MNPTFWGNLSIAFLLGLTLLEGVSGQKNVIKLHNGAYTNVLIAIDKEVEEDASIIENIKTMFTAASQRLYLASKQHVYWKEIKILVPTSWSRQSQYGAAKTETFESANILVPNNNVIDDGPHVEYLDGCGKPAHALHLSPKFITNESYREETFGATDKVLVRNWAYFRWGLFKEHYDGDDSGNTQPGYDGYDGNEEGTRCSMDIEGTFQMPDGRVCQKDPNSSGYHEECRFIPDKDGQTATSSLLFGPRGSPIDTIEEFCEEDPPPERGTVHNSHALNLMNKHCGGYSAWRVMKERTSDFVNGTHAVTNTTPVFNIIQAPSIRSVVLILDISSSMAGARFDKMIQACQHYIQQSIPDNSQLGIVDFSTTATIKSPLILVDDSSRTTLLNALPPTTISATCIGCGINLGISVLGVYSSGGYLVLLSDGGENIAPYIRDTYDNIDNSGVIIDTIAISDYADPQMIDLSERTSGIPAFCSDTDSAACMIQAFESTITERPDIGEESVPVQIYSSDATVPPNDASVIPVVIDAALGNETVITVTWTTASLIFVVISGPDGTVIDQSDSRYYVDVSTKLISVKLATAQPGVWNVTIVNSQTTTESSSVTVTSKPSTDEFKPISLGVILGSREVNFSHTRELAIYAQVQQDYKPVLDADVKAIISNSYGSTTTIPLLDNGSGSDLTREDGIYSGYFLDFSSNGRYNVKVDVIGYDDVVEVYAVHRGRGRRSNTVQSSSSEPSFMRTGSGGVFEVQSYTPNAPDTLPPSRIHDLMYNSFSYEDSTVNLTWTAVGDDLDQGQAFRYELRYATNLTVIRSYFNASHEVTQDQLLYGNLSNIAVAGVTETVIIELPERGADIVYYIAIRAWDDAGNVGDLSNIASLSIRYIAPIPSSSDLNTTGITLRCTATRMIVDIPNGLLEGDMAGDDVFFENAIETDSACWGQDVREKGVDIIRVTTNLTDCGTNRTETGDFEMYTNRVINRYASGEFVNRKYIIDIPLWCTYNRTKRVGYVTYGLTDYVIDKELSKTGAYSYSFDMFTDKNYTTSYEHYPVTIALNQEIYFAAELFSPNDVLDLDLSIQSCRATPSDDYDIVNHFDFIEDGCPNDPDTTLIYLNNHRIGVQTNTFRFIHGQQPEDWIYIHCDLLVCDPNDLNSPCATDCVATTKTHRKNRDVNSALDTKRFTRGPVRIVRAVENNHGNGGSSQEEIIESDTSKKDSAGSVTWMVTVAALVTIILTLAAVIFGLYRKFRKIASPVKKDSIKEEEAELLLVQVN